MVTIVRENELNKFNHYRGLSTDEKPMQNVPNGSTFFEMDTGATYYFDAYFYMWLYPNNTLVSITIDTAPTKTGYAVGEFFDPSGAVITAKMSNGIEFDCTSRCTYSPSGELALTDEKVTFSLTIAGVTKTADQTINMIA